MSLRLRRHGFTLLEVLVAAAILGLVLAALGRTLALGRSASAEIEATVEQQQARQLVEALLRFELGSAGYVPAGLVPPPPPIADPLVLRRQPELATGDVIQVRYVEDRDVATPLERDYAFSAGRDARGEAQLYRREGGGTRQPLVAGLTALRVTGVASAGRWRGVGAGSATPPVGGATGAGDGGAGGGNTGGAAEEPLRADGLRLALAFAWGETTELVVALPNRPGLRIEGGP